jgi:diacylglycerol kinase (ATP)
MQPNSLVIVNPNSGKRRGKHDWPLIKDLLEAAGFQFETVFTEYPMHAYKLVMKYISQGITDIITVGGDGTLNEVANGIMDQKEIPVSHISLGVIPVGKGNDWCRSFNIPYDYKKAVDIIKKRNLVCQDVGKVSYILDGTRNHRFFINVVGMGFDAAVATKVNKDKQQGKDAGELAYLKHIFTSLFGYKALPTFFQLDGKKIEKKVFSMNVGIGKFNGGGMKQLPNADPADGLLDLNIIKKISVVGIIFAVRRLFDGSILKMKQVEQYQAANIHIDADSLTWLEADGESLGHTPFEFTICPLALHVISGNPKT